MLAKNFEHLLSVEAKSRQNSPLKDAERYSNIDGLVFLGNGLPLSDYFPWNKISVETPKAPFAQSIGAKITESEAAIIEVAKSKGPENAIPLAKSLQYAESSGQKILKDFLKEHTRLVHGEIKYKDWDLMINSGNTQGWDNVLRTFCDPGDYILAEKYTFPSSLEAARGQRVKTIPVPLDEHGIVPESLEHLLNTWPATEKKPKLLYTIPTGQNPTGTCLSNSRRAKIYELAQKHDFIIVEDEPYYFLQMSPYGTKYDESLYLKSPDKFLESLVRSFLSLDVDGRVLRLDSFSKTLAPGARIGWITGNKRFIERLVRIQEVSMQNASGFSQSILNATLRSWGQEGFLTWLIKLRTEYTIRRDVTAKVLFESLPVNPGVVEFEAPVAGMFFTIRVNARKHPQFKELGEDPLKIEELIYKKAIEKGSFMVPGSWFTVVNVSQDEKPDDFVFYRGTYAATPLDELVVGLRRFGEAVREYY